MSTRSEKAAERRAAQQAEMTQAIKAELEHRLAALKEAGAEDHELEAVQVVFETFQTAAFISLVQFGKVGADPGLIITVYDRIVGQAEHRARTAKPYG